jgi:hypothetical protein
MAGAGEAAMSFLSRRLADPLPGLVERHLRPGHNLVDGWPPDRLAAYHGDALRAVL